MHTVHILKSSKKLFIIALHYFINWNFIECNKQLMEKKPAHKIVNGFLHGAKKKKHVADTLSY